MNDFREQARRRARDEREVVEWAIDDLEGEIAAADVDLEPLLEYARESKEGLPDRHLRAYETMAEEFDVDPDVYEVYALAYGRLCEELAADDTVAEVITRGCTNALVSPPRTDAAGALVLKNRDITGRGARPKAIVEQPAVGDYHGFITVDTCGTVMCYKGVNDQGLVSANTYIDVNRGAVEPSEQLRTGTVIRRILEECSSVDEAWRLLESVPTRRLMAQTLFLADDDDAVLLEIDPVAERIRPDEDDVVVRTNHFVGGESPEPESSRKRRTRALELLGERDRSDGGDRIDREDLWTIAGDHENGPGDDSICRHPEPETDEPHAFGQLTTASAAVFEGGSPEVGIVVGNPCETTPTRCRLGGDIPSDLRTGQRWPLRVLDERIAET